MTESNTTDRITVRRLPERGRYDRATIDAILDEGLVAHVGFATERGPVVIPMAYGREGDSVFVHGSVASRLLRTLSGGIDVCFTVTLLDGLVLARSVFHHSMNYRSVVVFGKARPVESTDQKMHALEVITEHLAPGRWATARLPNDSEFKATTVLELPIAEASAKIRTGGPKDDEEDLQLPVWAGHVDLRLEPVAVHSNDPVVSGVEAPPLERFRRG